MDKFRLQALRRLLFLSRQEAAQWVAAGPDRPNGVTDRSWRMWEDGTRTIPDDVSDRIEHLSAWRADKIKEHFAGGRKKGAQLEWFDTLGDWLSTGSEAIYWRPHQSVCAEAFARQTPGDHRHGSRAGDPSGSTGSAPDGV